MAAALLVILTAAVVYWCTLRRWFAWWGTTPDELARTMAGDSVIPTPTHTATQAITVNASPDDIWPWLVQMGYQRGGLYSYDWLDRLFGFLDHPSANRVLPEFQHLGVGDTIRLGPHQELTVAALEPARALALSYKTGGFDWVWQFGMFPLDNSRTRLVTRGSERYQNNPATWLFMRVMEPAAFIMTRRMLLGLKQRAETLRRERVRHNIAERVVA
jgi:hypothetical protein